MRSSSIFAARLPISRKSHSSAVIGGVVVVTLPRSRVVEIKISSGTPIPRASSSSRTMTPAISTGTNNASGGGFDPKGPVERGQVRLRAVDRQVAFAHDL